MTFITALLAPRLRPGKVVVLDNLRAHHDPAVAAAVEATGARLLFLPRYSPDLNPIEPMWFKVKAWLRTQAARTKDRLLRAIGRALASVTPADAAGWFNNSGYTQTQTQT